MNGPLVTLPPEARNVFQSYPVLRIEASTPRHHPPLLPRERGGHRHGGPVLPRGGICTESGPLGAAAVVSKDTSE